MLIFWGSDLQRLSSLDFTSNYNSANLEKSGMLQEQMERFNLKNVFAKGNQPIGVRQVSVSEYANNQLTGKGDFSPHQDYISNTGLNLKELKEWLGAEFLKMANSRFKNSIVPFYEGEGLTLNIGTTFSNSAEALNLKKPELSYGFDYVLRGFRKVDVGEIQTQKGSVWSVYSGIKFGVVLGEEPEDIKTLATIPFTQSTAEQYNKTDIINDWDNFDETTQVGIREISQNLIKQNKNWMKESSEISSKEFRNFAKTILSKVGYENKIKIIFVSLSILGIGFFPSYASTEVVVKGTGFNSFSKGCSKNKPSDKGLHEATMEKAKEKAWKRFINKQEDDVIDVYDENEDEILENLDDFILDMSVLNQECDKSSKTYELIVRLSIDDRAFNRFLTKATGNTSRQGALAGQTT